jgi:Ca-activated chloride channel family protein
MIYPDATFGGAQAAGEPSGPRGRGAGGSGGFGYAIPGSRKANVYRDIDSDKEVAATGVQNVGKETLYKRGKRWIANNAKDVDPDQKDAKITLINRFSDEYFKLVRDNTQDENTILATQQEGEELVVRLRGTAYLIK